MSKPVASLLTILALLLGACAAPGAGTPGPTTAASQAATPTDVAPTSPPTIAPIPTTAALCQAGPEESWVAIDAQANLFGAGLDDAPEPGGGGGGVLPPVIELPAGGTRLVTFPCTAGLTDCCAGNPSIGPGGFAGLLSTQVESHGGISGMIMEGRVMFLAGVFITDESPAEPAPERLDFTDNADFEELTPELGQTFFIGDGVDKTFVAPAGATRLYLGFVDAEMFVGKPGYYGNNRGALEATVAVAID